MPGGGAIARSRRAPSRHACGVSPIENSHIQRRELPQWSALGLAEGPGVTASDSFALGKAFEDRRERRGLPHYAEGNSAERQATYKREMQTGQQTRGITTPILRRGASFGLQARPLFASRMTDRLDARRAV